jgi:hypothetical protein
MVTPIIPWASVCQRLWARATERNDCTSHKVLDECRSPAVLSAMKLQGANSPMKKNCLVYLVSVVALSLMMVVGCAKKESSAPAAAPPAAEPAAPEAPNAPVESAADPVAPPCVPACDKKSCGDDGCGGSCGTCPGNATCGDGICNCKEPVCLGTCCDAGALCTLVGCCNPNCQDRVCGSDGCGGSCGQCASGVPCGKGQCQTPPDESWTVPVAGIKATASNSCRTRTEETNWGTTREISYGPGNLLDGDKATAWIECAKGPGIGQWLEFDFGRERKLTAVDLYIGYQRVENDEHGDRYDFNVRPKQILVTTATQSFSQPLEDRRDAQRIVLDGSPTRTLKITVEDVYLAKDKDCSFSEVLFHEVPDPDILQAWDRSLLKPGMTLVYRNETMDMSMFDSPDAEDVEGAIYPGYVLVQLDPVEGDARGFRIAKTEDVSSVSMELGSYFWTTDAPYSWGGGGVHEGDRLGYPFFPASFLLPSGESGAFTVMRTDDSEPGDQDFDAQLNAHFGYLASDAAGYSGVASQRILTWVDAYSTAASPAGEQATAATARLAERFKAWQEARVAPDATALAAFYANSTKPLLHLPGAAVVYGEPAMHVGPTTALVSFTEVVTTPTSKAFALRELQWTVVDGELKISAQTLIRDKQLEHEGGAAPVAAVPSPGPRRVLPTTPAVFSPEEAARLLPAGNVSEAKKLNSQGFKARKRGDNAQAMDFYRQAVAASPAHGRARLNLACELALAGEIQSAIDELTWLYRSGSEEDLDLLAAASSDEDLRSIWGQDAFLALVDGAAGRRQLAPKEVLKGGCHGFSATTGTVACGYFADTSEWSPTAGGVLFGHPTGVYSIVDEDETINDTADMAAELQVRRVAPVRLPKFPLKAGQETPLGGTGYVARWDPIQDSEGEAPLGKLTLHGPRGMGPLVVTPKEVVHGAHWVAGSGEAVLWMVPGWDRFVLEVTSEFEAAYEDGQMVQGPESWNALALVELPGAGL